MSAVGFEPTTKTKKLFIGVSKLAPEQDEIKRNHGKDE